jgi:cation diffusion facilitator CzcD-associated flavoprotein CzcO
MPSSDVRHVEIAIAGAGLSGLGMAIALRRDGHSDFVVLERASELGGTWRDNSYPGCAWEIWAYMRRVAARHDIADHMLYDHEVTAADWDGEAQRWNVETTQARFTADVLISATGALADPVIPALPGLERFTGRVFHSARWEHDHDLRGRRVAVVGTGPAATRTSRRAGGPSFTASRARSSCCAARSSRCTRPPTSAFAIPR